MTFGLFSCIQLTSEKRSTLRGKKKVFLENKLFPFRVDPVPDGKKNKFAELHLLNVYQLSLTHISLMDFPILIH